MWNCYPLCQCSCLSPSHYWILTRKTHPALSTSEREGRYGLGLNRVQVKNLTGITYTPTRAHSILPLPSSILTTKYRLESVTASTTVPGYCSTGAWAKSSPGEPGGAQAQRELRAAAPGRKASDTAPRDIHTEYSSEQTPSSAFWSVPCRNQVTAT